MRKSISPVFIFPLACLLIIGMGVWGKRTICSNADYQATSSNTFVDSIPSSRKAEIIAHAQEMAKLYLRHPSFKQSKQQRWVWSFDIDDLQEIKNFKAVLRQDEKIIIGIINNLRSIHEELQTFLPPLAAFNPQEATLFDNEFDKIIGKNAKGGRQPWTRLLQMRFKRPFEVPASQYDHLYNNVYSINRYVLLENLERAEQFINYIHNDAHIIDDIEQQLLDLPHDKVVSNLIAINYKQSIQIDAFEVINQFQFKVKYGALPDDRQELLLKYRFERDQFHLIMPSPIAEHIE